MEKAKLTRFGTVLVVGCAVMTVVALVRSFWFIAAMYLVAGLWFLYETVKMRSSISEDESEYEEESEESGELDESWELKEIAPNIFLQTCGNNYDLAMRFLRYQEFYESPNADFRGQAFTLTDFMDWYSKDNDLYFSYPYDWNGFNLPGQVFRELTKKKIPDWNQYDEAMHDVVQSIREKVDGDDPDHFYLIGALIGDEETIDHELAHAFYHIFPKYKREMDEALAGLYHMHKRVLSSTLEGMGYTPKVHNDELQAYFSTGLCEELETAVAKHQMMPDAETLCEPFETIFAKWQNFYIES